MHARITQCDATDCRFGPLAGNSAGSSAYPLSLDITPDGGLLVYGYSQYIYGFPVGTPDESSIKVQAPGSIGGTIFASELYYAGPPEVKMNR